MRAVSELRERAEELRRMAATARTTDTHVALMSLAQRFDALALKRSGEEPDDASAGNVL